MELCDLDDVVDLCESGACGRIGRIRKRGGLARGEAGVDFEVRCLCASWLEKRLAVCDGSEVFAMVALDRLLVVDEVLPRFLVARSI